jgi:hypothetical protein
MGKKKKTDFQEFREYFRSLYDRRPKKLRFIASFLDDFIETITGFFVAVLALPRTFPNKFVRNFAMKLCLDPQFSFLGILDHFNWSYAEGTGLSLVLRSDSGQTYTYDLLKSLVLKEPSTESNIESLRLNSVNKLCCKMYYVFNKYRKEHIKKVHEEKQFLIKAFLCSLLSKLLPDQYGKNLKISKKTVIEERILSI